MADAELTATLGNFCDANTHGDLVVLEDAVPVFSTMIHWDEAKEPLEPQELKQAVYVLLREMVRRSGATTKQQVNTVIPQLSITLNYPT